MGMTITCSMIVYDLLIFHKVLINFCNCLLSDIFQFLQQTLKEGDRLISNRIEYKGCCEGVLEQTDNS